MGGFLGGTSSLTTTPVPPVSLKLKRPLITTTLMTLRIAAPSPARLAGPLDLLLIRRAGSVVQVGVKEGLSSRGEFGTRPRLADRSSETTCIETGRGASSHLQGTHLSAHSTPLRHTAFAAPMMRSHRTARRDTSRSRERGTSLGHGAAEAETVWV
jgi:hypothetical protein